ncbi:putative Ig domain-containing protein [Larkinella punicea]|nr:putative Ig domain-containing protein [Larkinella punicea]
MSIHVHVSMTRRYLIRAVFICQLVAVAAVAAVQAQPPLRWDKTFGGSSSDGTPEVVQTADGGFLLGGSSSSNASGDKSENSRGGLDYWVIRMDAQGNKLWDKTFGGSEWDDLNAIVPTTDGGFLLCGSSRSGPSDDKTEDSRGDLDYWVVRIDAGGNKLWDKTYGGDGYDDLTAAVLTTDDGFLLGGSSTSGQSGDKTEDSRGNRDYWVVRIDDEGNMLWDKTLGGGEIDYLTALATTSDDGFLVAGYSLSGDDGDKTEGNKGGGDYWVIKLDEEGNTLWDKAIGGSETDYLSAVLATPDGGFLLAGASGSNTSGDKTEDSRGDQDYWVVKLNADRAVEWDKTLGGDGYDGLFSALLTADNGFLVGGYSYSGHNGDKSEENKGDVDYWVIKLDEEGNILWDKTVGGTGADYLSAMTTTLDGGFLLAGRSDSNAGGDKSDNSRGDSDYWVVKLKACEVVPSSLTLTSNVVNQPLFQNTPSVLLTVSGCKGGTVAWTGPGGSSGTGVSIPVPTSATGTLVYSATCTGGLCPTAPGSATITVSPPLVAGSFDGYIYGADCNTFRGWAWDRNKPNTIQSVDILDGPNVVVTIPANEFRQDLKDAGKGNGIHAFRWSIPAGLKDGQVHYLSARVAGSSFILKDSPKALVCEEGASSPPNKQPVPPTVSPLVAQQNVAFTTTLPAFTDPENSTLSYGLVSLPTGLSFTPFTRQISGTPTQSGLFVLTYSATDDKGATNSVSFNLTVNPAATTPVTGSFEGYLDKVECGTIRGWVWDRNKPNTPVTVEFYNTNTLEVYGSVVANIYRVDLLNAGKGNGAHAYSFEVPAGLKDNTTRLISARVSGSTYVLKDSGKPLTCLSASRLSAESNREFQVTVLGNPLSRDAVEVEIRGAEGEPVRLALTDVTGRLVTERLIEKAGVVERQAVPVGKNASGILFLRASSGSRSVTLKVLRN